MARWSRLGVAAVALGVALGACDKPLPPDPAEAAYHQAIELFAKASADTGDLTYRNPRFDEVLAALAEVPHGDELRAKADALAQQILTARAEANRADGESADAVAQALAAPEFSPQARDVPFPLPGGVGKPGAKAAGSQTASDNVGYGGGGYSPSASRKSSASLPDWYRQAGYLGLGKHPRAAAPTGQAAAATGPPPPADPAANTPAGPAQSSNTAPSTATPAVPQGPPPIFGLPGPAGRAVMGGR
jgi:hypothetical protein